MALKADVGCIKGTLCSGKLSTLIRKLGRRKKVIEEEKEKITTTTIFSFSLASVFLLL
jgi:hypothetical protein